MMAKKCKLPCLILLNSLFVFSVAAQESVPTSSVSSVEPSYPDSTVGIQSQMDELIHLIRSSDEKTFLAALDSLKIPDSQNWFALHFPTYASSQLEQDYEKAFAAYRSHVWWVVGNFGKDPNFALQVSPSETPRPLEPVGFEALLPVPNTPLKLENFRFSPATQKPPSWVAAFLFLNGRFRFVGGTYPFWNEKLTPLRGPMAIPSRTIGDLTVQGVPVDVDPGTPGIVAIVILDIKIGNDGKVHGFKVKSGQSAYIEQAENYVKDWKFFPMASNFQMNVVFFKLAH